MCLFGNSSGYRCKRFSGRKLKTGHASFGEIGDCNLKQLHHLDIGANKQRLIHKNQIEQPFLEGQFSTIVDATSQATVLHHCQRHPVSDQFIRLFVNRHCDDTMRRTVHESNAVIDVVPVGSEALRPARLRPSLCRASAARRASVIEASHRGQSQKHFRGGCRCVKIERVYM